MTETENQVSDVSKTNNTNNDMDTRPARSKDVALSNQGVPTLNRLNLFNSTDLVAAENFLMKIMKSDKGGIKTVNEGLAVLMRAQDLNLPFSTCLEHIHVINGKTGVDVHIIKALLLRAGCTWTCEQDYQPLYEYTDGYNVYVDNALPDYTIRCLSKKDADSKAKADIEKGIDDHVYVYPVKWYKDFNGNMYKDYQLNSTKFGIAINASHGAEITKSGKVAVYRVASMPVDYITKYRFTRNVNGKEIEAFGWFTYSDAVKAGMFDKDTYKKYPRILIGHRAFTYGAREIASDILFGVMETTELKVTTNVPLTSDDYETYEEVDVIVE